MKCLSPILANTALALLSLVAIAFLFAATGCQGPATDKAAGRHSDSTYTLTGEIQGLDSDWVYLKHEQTEQGDIDSVRAGKGRFVFTGRAAAPEFCLFALSNAGTKEFRTGFFIQNGELVLSGKKDSIDEASLTGSPAEEEFKRFEQGQLLFYSAFGAMRQDYEMARTKNDEKKIDSLQKAAVKLNASQRRSIVLFALDHPSSYVAPYVVFSNFENNPDVHQLDSAYKGMDSAIQASYYGKKVKGMRDDAIRTAIGNPATDFTLPDPQGKPVSLSSYKGKYTLVDFWASWCGPCRGENPNVVKAYRKYHAKGFAILGVSLDTQKESWEQAIKKDKLTWTQVSDLKGWESSAAALYGVKAIPMNFLLDKEGKIVGKGLRGEELEKKLAEALK